MRLRIIVLTLLSYFTLNSQTNQNNVDFIDKIYDFALSKGKSYEAEDGCNDDLFIKSNWR